MKLKLIQRYIRPKNEDCYWPQVYSSFVVSFGALTYGTSFAWPSPTIPTILTNSSHLNDVTLEEMSYFTVIPPLTTMLVVSFITMLMDKIGTRTTVWLLGIPQILSWLLVTFSNGVLMLYISRVLYGISQAGMFCIPIYSVEVASPKLRGLCANSLNVFYFLGTFLINVVGSCADIKTTALIFVTLPLLHMVLILTVPESPYYLIMKGRMEEAENALRLLRWNNNVQKEFNEIVQCVNRQNVETRSLKDIWTVRSNRKALLIVITVVIGLHASGFSSFNTYTQYIFYKAGAGILSPEVSAVIYTFVTAFATVITFFIVDRMKRRFLLLISVFGCVISLFAEAVYFYLILKTNVDLTNFNWLPLFSLSLYILMCLPGLGFLPVLMVAEMFPVSVKTTAAGIIGMLYCTGILVVPKLFQFLTVNFGMDTPFFLFGTCTTLLAVFCYYCVPETGSKTLDEIQLMLMGKSSQIKKAISQV